MLSTPFQHHCVDISKYPSGLIQERVIFPVRLTEFFEVIPNPRERPSDNFSFVADPQYVDKWISFQIIEIIT